VNDFVEEQRAHITLGRVYLALAIKFADEGVSDEARNGALNKAEREFIIARDLCNHSRLEFGMINL